MNDEEYIKYSEYKKQGLLFVENNDYKKGVEEFKKACFIYKSYSILCLLVKYLLLIDDIETSKCYYFELCEKYPNSTGAHIFLRKLKNVLSEKEKKNVRECLLVEKLDFQVDYDENIVFYKINNAIRENKYEIAREALDYAKNNPKIMNKNKNKIERFSNRLTIMNYNYDETLQFIISLDADSQDSLEGKQVLLNKAVSEGRISDFIDFINTYQNLNFLEKKLLLIKCYIYQKDKEKAEEMLHIYEEELAKTRIPKYVLEKQINSLRQKISELEN